MGIHQGGHQVHQYSPQGCTMASYLSPHSGIDPFSSGQAMVGHSSKSCDIALHVLRLEKERGEHCRFYIRCWNAGIHPAMGQ